MVSGVDLIPESWISFFRAAGSLSPDSWVKIAVVYRCSVLSWSVPIVIE
jgi:hypothetical protein